MREVVIVILVIIGAILAALMGFYGEKNSNQEISRHYRKNCINGVLYLESKYDGYITPLINSDNKPITCQIERKK